MNDKLDLTGGFHALFYDKGVEIFLPTSNDYNGVLVREFPEDDLKKNFPPSEETKEEKSEDFWKRGVINFEVVKYDPTDKNLEDVKTFAPSIHLKVYYSQNDLNKVGNDQEKLNLYYLPENKDEWKLFTAEHSLRREEIEYGPDEPIEGDTWVGFFTVWIKEWGDPSVAAGN